MKIVKKVLFCGIGLICLSLLFAVPSMAAFYCDSSGSHNLQSGSIDFKCSKNVQINCNSNGQTYAANAGHYSGNRAYGVSSDSSVVYYTSKDKGTSWDSSNSPSASDSSAFGSWHS
ncbi:MAG: hypothetical protein DRG39_05565, partial [Deltaproteobacteria bacterium]